MTLIGPVYLLLGDPGTEFGDYVTSIQRQSPQIVTVAGINRNFNGVPKRGNVLVVSGVEETLEEGSLWRWLYDHAGETDIPVVWSSYADGDVYFQSTIEIVPDPGQGGQANQHGQFTINIPLLTRGEIIDNPEGS